MVVLNMCADELFLLYYAGIADAIASFKWRKIFLFFENIYLPNIIIWLTKCLPQTTLSFSGTYYLV